MTDRQRGLNYMNYLAVDELLSLQRPVSDGPEHDELLFITIHQVYELWFKQIIHEVDSVMFLLSQDKIDEENVGVVVGRFDRVNKILDILVKQLDILETMTALDFLDFRNYLSPASGFQSHQCLQSHPS